ncbi:hypothetical protein K1719_018119 [Acacia pycnantha]|nr:hypothetical protein K1719_018119 [Acacia pycnantha]
MHFCPASFKAQIGLNFQRRIFEACRREIKKQSQHSSRLGVVRIFNNVKEKAEFGILRGSDRRESSTQAFEKLLDLKKEKLNHFKFYWNEIVIGQNPTSVIIVLSPVNSTTTFRLLNMIDNPLTLAPNWEELKEAKKHRSAAAAVVVGTVYCDTCFQRDFPMRSHFISGASIVVECKDSNSKPKFRKEAKIDKHGEFKVQLPFLVSKHMRRIKGCTMKLLSSSEPYCAAASASTSSSLHLKSRKQGKYVFSAGFFSFKPLKQPNLCNQKPRIENPKEIGSFSRSNISTTDSGHTDMRWSSSFSSFITGASFSATS